MGVRRSLGGPALYNMKDQAGTAEKKSRKKETRIGKIIAEYREMKGINAKELANMLGFSHSMVLHWENGISKPSFDVALKLCDILDIPLEEFFDITLSEKILSSQERRIITAYRSVGDEDKKLILAVVDKLKELASLKDSMTESDLVEKVEKLSPKRKDQMLILSLINRINVLTLLRDRLDDSDKDENNDTQDQNPDRIE